jgi:hypothetical protein
MLIDVPAQFVETAYVQSQVYVLPSANWAISQLNTASVFVLKDDPEDFQTLEWETEAAGPGKAGKPGKVKKRAVIRKHGKASKATKARKDSKDQHLPQKKTGS